MAAAGQLRALGGCLPLHPHLRHVLRLPVVSASAPGPAGSCVCPGGRCWAWASSAQAPRPVLFRGDPCPSLRGGCVFMRLVHEEAACPHAASAAGESTGLPSPRGELAAGTWSRGPSDPQFPAFCQKLAVCVRIFKGKLHKHCLQAASGALCCQRPVCLCACTCVYVCEHMYVCAHACAHACLCT